MKIGITERGDPSIDFTWTKKLDKVDGAILITKNLTDKVIDQAIPYFDKLIFHISCTGYGQTVVEPNIPAFENQLSQAQKLIGSGFPADRVVIRIDPIIPTKKGLVTATGVFKRAYKLGFRRFRVSLIDCYPHVRERMHNMGLMPPYGDKFYPEKEQIDATNNIINQWKKECPEACIESCAERDLVSTERIGCLSKKDLDLLGLKMKNPDDAGFQRHGCLCCSAKN